MVEPDMTSGTVTADVWLGRYRQDGVFFPIPVLDGVEVSFFRESLESFEQCFRQRFGHAPAGTELGQCHLHLGWARRLAAHPRLLDVAEVVLGPDILVHSTTIFHKHAYSGSYVSWHQDGYFMRLDRPDFLSVWVALSDSTPENGCLRVVAGSHRNGRMPHGDGAAADRNLLTSGLEISEEVKESDATDVVLRAGEASLHHIDTVHGSNPNRSASGRIGFAVRLVAPHVRQAGPHHSVVLARGRDGFGGYRIHTDPPFENAEAALDAHFAFSQELLAQRVAAGRKS